MGALAAKVDGAAKRNYSQQFHSSGCYEYNKQFGKAVSTVALAVRKLGKYASTWIAILMAIVLMCAFPQANASAAESSPQKLDPDAKGSITVTVKGADDGMAQGDLSLYKVANISANGSGWRFEWLPAYQGVDDGLSDATGELSEAYSSQLASALNNLVDSQTAITTATVDADGIARFSNVDVGLYLVKQTAVSQDSDPLESFVVSVPVVDEGTGELVYDVDASREAGNGENRGESEPADSSPKPKSTTTPVVPSGKLPQVGQLWWPVGLFITAGVVMLCIGVIHVRQERSPRR